MSFQLYLMTEGVTPCVAETSPDFGSLQDLADACKPEGTYLRGMLVIKMMKVYTKRLDGAWVIHQYLL